jgi:hypothetical protein
LKSAAILTLLLCGFLLRAHGWQFLARQEKGPGMLLVIGGTLVTLSIVVVALATAGT